MGLWNVNEWEKKRGHTKTFDVFVSACIIVGRLWPLLKTNPGQSFRSEFGNRDRAIINILLLMKDTVISPSEAADEVQPEPTVRRALRRICMATWSCTALFWWTTACVTWV